MPLSPYLSAICLPTAGRTARSSSPHRTRTGQVTFSNSTATARLSSNIQKNISNITRPDSGPSFSNVSRWVFSSSLFQAKGAMRSKSTRSGAFQNGPCSMKARATARSSSVSGSMPQAAFGLISTSPRARPLAATCCATSAATAWPMMTGGESIPSTRAAMSAV